ncbi:MAG: hypothetical protein WDO15_27045 [Bacteroidota bacterium]
MKHLYLLRLSLLITSLWALSTQFSFAQATRTSQANGPWSTGSTWVGGVAPGPLDKAIIQHTVTVTAAATCAGVTVSAGTLRFNMGAPRNFTVNGDLLQTGGDIITFGGGTTTILLSGNFTRNGGTYTSVNGGLRTDNTFTGTGAQSVGGSQATTYNNFTVNAGSNVTLGNAATINRTLTINAGSSLTVPNVSIAANVITGNTSISGDLLLTAAGGNEVVHGCNDN